MQSGKVYAIDLFCGAGGLTHGLQRSGIDVIAGLDLDPACEYAYTENNKTKFILADIAKVTGDDIKALWPEDGYRLLAGCAPCQVFSSYTQAKKLTKKEKWSMVDHFLRLIKEVEPDFVTMENVANLKKEDIFSIFVETLKELNYDVWHDIVECASYGVPQQRKRLVLLASRVTKIQIIPPTCNKPKTVKEAIGKLPPLEAGECSKKDILHRASTLSEVNMKRMLASKPGGTWRDWPIDIVAECHKSKTGKSYPSVYGRMEWEKVSPTITTQFYGFGNGRFGHPEQNRGLSLREGAILQTFPPTYKFLKAGQEMSMRTIGRLIGNAVPVDLGAAIGKSILQSFDPHGVGSQYSLL